MGDFQIGFTGQLWEEDPAMAVGEIRLGEERDTFLAAIGFWSPEDYRRSWVAALRRTVAGAEVSCLVTSLTDPAQANFVTTWPMYRPEGGDAVHVQNRLLFLDELEGTFAPDAPWESVPPREVVDEDGKPIPEWVIRLTDVREFLDAQP